MENTNLQQLLQTLTKSEWREFGDFLSSPFFNKNEKFIRFYHQINPYQPGFVISEPEKQRIYIETTQSKAWNDAGYRNICSDFLELLQSFITQLVIASGSSQKGFYLNMELLQRGQLALVEKNLKKISSYLKTDSIDIGERLRTEVWLADLHTLLNIRMNRSRIHHASQFMINDTSFRTNTELLLLKVFITFHNYITATQNQNEPFDKERIKPFLQLYEAFEPFEHVEVALNYFLLRMVSEGADDNYYKTKELFISVLDKLHNKDKSNMMTSLLNFVNGKVGSDESWREEVFALHDLKLTKRLWSNHSDLGYVSLFTAVQNALQMNRITYAEDILEQYSPFLNHVIRDSIYHLSKGFIALFKGDYSFAHQCIQKVETENNLLKYEIRVLQLLVYFEQKEWNLLASALESFRQFIQYNKPNISPEITDQYLTFVKQMQQLMKLPPAPSQKQRDQLIKTLRTDGHAYFKSWLLRKAQN